MSPPVLHVRQLSLRFGGLKVLDRVDLDVAARELVALIGPNGAGKTSLLNCISGVHRPRAGSIHFEQRDLTGLPAHQVAAAGIGRTFQHLELFPHLSVAQNVLLGRHLHFRAAHAALGAPGEERAQAAAIEPLLDLLGLHAQRARPAGALPYAQQKLVGLGRALALEPRLLLLDEPAAGMHPRDKDNFVTVLRHIRATLDLPMLWIEHDLDLVADLASRVVVLDFGTLIAEGSPRSVLRDPRVVRVYLGS